jgi:hypothetical protein
MAIQSPILQHSRILKGTMKLGGCVTEAVNCRKDFTGRSSIPRFHSALNFSSFMYSNHAELRNGVFATMVNMVNIALAITRFLPKRFKICECRSCILRCIGLRQNGTVTAGAHRFEARLLGVGRRKI